MSFYFDDDDDAFVPLSQTTAATPKKGDDDDDDDMFVCDNCGGTESYMDEATGTLTCTQCYTQSQNIIDESQI